jgi:putative ABC transport system permease protein
LRTGLVIGQLALTLPLVVCAGLVVRHIIALRSVDVGFNTDRLLVVQVDLPFYRYDTGTSQATFVEAGVRAARATPGVRSAAAVNFVPLGGARSSVTVTIEGREVADPSRPDLAGFQIVTPGYFDMMETPILAGRDFGEHDHAEASRVVIVNRKMATRYWPNDDAVGKRLKAHFSSAEDPWATVVGVVGDTGHAGLYQEPRPEVFFPYTQKPTSNVVIVARTQGDPMEVADPLRGAVRRIDPGLPIYGIRSMADILHRWTRDDRMAVGFLCGLAVLALSLASIGLYGVMSYSVAQRTHEIGVRVALGAGGREIQRLVLRRCLVMAAVGVAVGLALSCGVGLVLQSQLYGVGGLDPITFVSVSFLLLAVAAAAGYLPARRATKVDPMAALRYE